MKALDVHLHDEHVGALKQVSQGRLEFSYTAEWVERDGLAISNSLPVRPGPFDDDLTRPFFSGLLPEGEFLRGVARLFGVSATNPFSLLDSIGGECAGAISLAGQGKDLPAVNKPALLNSSELKKLIEELPTRPLTFDIDDEQEALRLSLAGAQEKLPVVFAGGLIGITRGIPPSTHIIKLPMERLDGMVANEAYCMTLAGTVGLRTAQAMPWSIDLTPTGDDPGPEFLLVTRYDRESEGSRTIRLHQEDFCQSLGVPPELKYQNEGGPDPGSCSKLISDISSAPAVDILTLADSLIFNLIIGNRDAHAKNFSFLLEGTGAPRLAPLYDLFSTRAYPELPRKMAMKIGGEYRADRVQSRHLDRLADDLGIGATMFRARVRSLTERISTTAPIVAEAMDPDFAKQSVVKRILDQIEAGVKQMLDATDTDGMPQVRIPKGSTNSG